ncbi:hypothetical protein AVEN_140277-1 [Araneus ventricosus]|uniref:Uncharacterized protein n=1 Tax=Araneus ventricosus TaxID=182803 RepID=A0A4Y2SAV6_ARAVE|nr:hypothetical protein AVEN_140277-1 [Araneus ventricosus]
MPSRRPTPHVCEEAELCRHLSDRGNSADMVERASGSQYSSTSARAVSRDLPLPWSTVQNVLRYIVKWYPYKIHVVQALKPADPDKRYQLFLARIVIDNLWPRNTLWSDEEHFTLDGAVNTQNCRIWGTERPNIVKKQSLHPYYIPVWGSFTADFILGHFPLRRTLLMALKGVRCYITDARYCGLL